MFVIVRTILLSGFFLVLAGCSDTHSNADNGFAVEKKYSLRECVVRLDLLWNQMIEASARYRVLQEVGVQVNRAIVSGDFPLFSGGYSPRDPKYYVFYYADQCEQRRELVQELVKEYFLPNVPDFPEYQIEDKDIQPGFDGAMPSGWWIDG